MMQTAIAVAAGMLLLGCFVQRPPSPAALRDPVRGTTSFEVASDGINAPLPSATASPASVFGTPLEGASPMPSAKSFTHTMYDV